MSTLTTLIVDDEYHGRSNLTILIKQCCPELEVIGEASGAIEAKQMISSLSPQVVFLDIHMPEHDGFDLLSWLNKRDFALLFCTAYPDYGVNALREGAVDYIMKPLIISELQAAVKRVVAWHEQRDAKNNETEQLQAPKDKIMLAHAGGYTLADIKDIVRLESDNNYTMIYLTDNRQYLVSKTLKEFETSLEEESFFRIHKSDLINLNAIVEYSHNDGGTVKLKDGTKIQVARTRQQEFLAALKKWSISIG